MGQVTAYGVMSPTSPFETVTIERRAVGPSDVEIEITHCGICHSDMHFIRGDWGPDAVAGSAGTRKRSGRVKSVGKDVKRYKVGDLVGVGVMVHTCHECAPCKEGEEQFCEKGKVEAYNGVEHQTGRPTYGGYSKSIVVDEYFVLRIPPKLKPEHAAPLLCAGITVYSPMLHWKVGPGSKVGVVGLGGLGHLAVKLAKAMGAQVVVFTHSPSKVADAKALGADEVIMTNDAAAMAKHANSFNLILDAVSAAHDLETYVAMLRHNGTLCLLGLPPINESHKWPAMFTLLGYRRAVAASPIGSIRETQQMLDLCAEKGVAPEIEIIGPSGLNAAYARLEKGDIRYRFVIDMAA